LKGHLAFTFEYPDNVCEYAIVKVEAKVHGVGKSELTMVIGFGASSFPLWKQESFFRMRFILAMKGIVCVS